MDIHQKKQKKVEEKDYPNYQQGDCYAYIAIKRETNLHLAHAVGKRIDLIAEHIVWKLSTILQLPTFTYKLEVYTDGNKQYITALLTHFRKDCIVYGQLIKKKKNKRFVYKFKKKIFGNPDYNDIDTVNIESYNSILRERIGCLVRRTKCFSKQRSRFEKRLDIFQAYNNTMKEDSDGKTPCMKEDLTAKKWQWMDFFMYR